MKIRVTPAALNDLKEIKAYIENDLSITDIATMCGFNDSNYFSSVFKKLKGIPPLKFRANNL